MSASAITLGEFAQDFAVGIAAILPELQPDRRALVGEWLGGLREVASVGNSGAVACYIKIIREQVELERAAQERST
jgi:hypothetical protein